MPVSPTKNQYLYGTHPVHEAIKAGRRTIHGIFVTRENDKGRHKHLLTTAISRGIPIEKVDSARLNNMVKTELHQGICARVSSYPAVSLDQVISLWKKKAEPPFMMILDSIKDPNNLGAIIRTAACAGVHGIVIPKDRSAGPTPAVSKASAGALEHAFLCRVVNLANAIKRLKSEGLWIAGLDMESTRTVFSADLSGPIAVVVGGEEKGIRPLVKKQCDFMVKVPQTGHVDSLNASVAAAVTIYEIYRRRIGSEQNHSH